MLHSLSRLCGRGTERHREKPAARLRVLPAIAKSGVTAGMYGFLAKTRLSQLMYQLQKFYIEKSCKISRDPSPVKDGFGMTAHLNGV